MKSRSRSIFWGLLMVLMLVATACPQQADDETPKAKEELQEGGTITFASEQEHTGFNINTSKDNLFALQHVMGLVWPTSYSTRPDFSVHPDLLASRAKVVTETPFVVEWKIKKEAIWDDGKPVSADDFELYWQNCNGKDEKADCASTSGYDLISKLEKVDAKTVRTTFDKPYPEFEALFGNLVPAHIAKARPGGWNTGFDADPGVSAGPYKVKEWVKGDHLTLIRNDKFWGKKPRLDSITIRYIPDAATHPAALQNGEVTLIYPQPQVDLVQQVKQIPGTKSEIGFGPTWEHITFNFKNPHLAVKEVRQAVTYGIDRDAIVKAILNPFSDKATKLDNRIYVQNQKEYEAHGKEYAKRDVKKAQAALEKAGYAKGADGIYAKGGKKLSLRFSYRSPNPRRQAAVELAQAQLKEVGIEITIDAFTGSLGKTLAGGQFDLIIFAFVGTPFPASGADQVFKTGSDSNFGFYSSAEVDKKLGEATTELDAKKRAQILNDIDEILWTDLSDIPLFQLPTFIAHSDRYVNIIDNTTSSGPFWNAYDWGIKKAAA